ncbi:hypothetical protein Btru_032186 [Bulinus truncatus]|nr:hypothetical protein Btru_032186 [Bulinus truncatus]
MSSFVSSTRRRFSPPEKPQPKFEWRMRVHSLMMDEKENVDSTSDRRSHRYDTGRYSWTPPTKEVSNDNAKHSKSSHEMADDQGHEHRRRSRFLRTKSEGYLKVRLRLSKFSDISKSQEDAESLKDSVDYGEQEDHGSSTYLVPGDGTYRDRHLSYHRRDTANSSQRLSDRTSGRYTENVTDDDPPAAATDHPPAAATDDPPAVATDDPPAAAADDSPPAAAADDAPPAAAADDPPVAAADDPPAVAADDMYGTEGRYKSRIRGSEGDQDIAAGEVVCSGGAVHLDSTQGAIPKRYANISDSNVSDNNNRHDSTSTSDRHNDHTSKKEDTRTVEEGESPNVSFKKETPARPISADDNFRKSNETAPEANDNYKCFGASDSESWMSDVAFKKNEPDYGDQKHLEENEMIVEDLPNGSSPSSGEAEGSMDDIESIIEQIIAEEEAMLDGKQPSAKLIQDSLKKMSKEDISALRTQVQNLQDEINRCNEEAENGVAYSQNTTQRKQRSFSLPFYYAEDQPVGSVTPYSSSCPHAQESTVQNKVQRKEEEEDDFNSWAYLPVILLEDILTLLSPKERHQASQVCRQWYDLFYSPRVWETFILLERTLTKKRFNLYKGYQRELCPGKTQLCFRRVGSFFKRIVVTPISDYFNLYEFLRILAAFLQFQEDHGQKAMPLLHTFDFTFACASRSEGVEMVHGTGGQILEMIIQLLVRMSNLKHLKLNQLLVDVGDVPSLFDAIVNCFGESLSSLELLNVTKVPLALPDLSRFRNLVKLTVSPQHLNDEVVLLLSGLNIMHLHLLQDPYTCECESVSSDAWKLVREIAPWLQVYLEVSGITRSRVLIQPRAPVHGVFLRTPYTRLTNDLVMALVENYSKTLRYFVQERLPRTHGPRGFNNRSDSSFLFLVRRCPVLHTLVIRERISTSTVILLANEGRRLSTLLVRKNGLIKRCDWPQCGEMSKEFYANLKAASLDYGKCTDEICKILKRRWKPMEDKQFMRLKIVPRMQIC